MMMSHMQFEHDENMMMACLCHANVKQTMMMWCSGNANTNDVCHATSLLCGTNGMQMLMTS